MRGTSSQPPAALDDNPLLGKRITFLGKLGSMNRRQAAVFVRQQGAVPVDCGDDQLDIIVIGADHLPLSDDEFLSTGNSAGRVEIIHETEFWERLGYLPEAGPVRKLYTPAMLAELLEVPIAVIRRWHRRGLIVPVREVHRLAYFDFQEVATARHLAQLLAAGASPTAIEKKLEQLAEWVPHVDRPLAQLSVIVQGRDLLLRQGAGLIDATGQRRFDFEASESTTDAAARAEGSSRSQPHPPLGAQVYSITDYFSHATLPTPSHSDLLEQASKLEEGGWLEDAIDVYRVALAIGGPDAEINFQMAELLYRIGDTAAARERYYATLEIDEDYVEARANLGCVLAETGQLELAVAAFQGALSRHSDFPDVHFHLARTLDELDRAAESDGHWRKFLALAPDSPWAEEACDRLGLDTEPSDNSGG